MKSADTVIRVAISFLPGKKGKPLKDGDIIGAVDAPLITLIAVIMLSGLMKQKVLCTAFLKLYLPVILMRQD